MTRSITRQTLPWIAAAVIVGGALIGAVLFIAMGVQGSRDAHALEKQRFQVRCGSKTSSPLNVAVDDPAFRQFLDALILGAGERMQFSPPVRHAQHATLNRALSTTSQYKSSKIYGTFECASASNYMSVLVAIIGGIRARASIVRRPRCRPTAGRESRLPFSLGILCKPARVKNIGAIRATPVRFVFRVSHFGFRIAGLYRRSAGDMPDFTGDMPDHAGHMPDFAPCVIERLYTVYFEHSVPEIANERIKHRFMPDFTLTPAPTLIS